MSAKVVSVSSSAKHGFSKEPRESIRLIAGEGVEGDAHRGLTTQHLYRVRKDPTQPNLTQVHLLAQEMLGEVAAKGFAVQPGELGENVLTSGIELLALPLDTVLRIGDEAVVRVTGLRTPCSQIDRYQQGLQQHMWGERSGDGKRTRRAGIMGVILQGGVIRPQDEIWVELPPLPHKVLPGV